jgi:hypothetical protein
MTRDPRKGICLLTLALNEALDFTPLPLEERKRYNTTERDLALADTIPQRRPPLHHRRNNVLRGGVGPWGRTEVMPLI